MPPLDLSAVKRAARDRRAARDAYRRALVDAHAAGATYAELAAAAGVSRQAVRVLISRATSSSSST